MHPPSFGPFKTYAACAGEIADTGSLRKLSFYAGMGSRRAPSLHSLLCAGVASAVCAD